MRSKCLVLIAVFFAGSVFAEAPPEKTSRTSRIDKFKARIYDASFATSWLLKKENGEQIDLLKMQREEIVRLRKKYMEKMFAVVREVNKIHKPIRYTSTPEESAQFEARLRALALKKAPVSTAWRKELERVLTPKQIVRMNELMWQYSWRDDKVWFLALGDEIHRALQLTPEQTTALVEIRNWMHTRSWDKDKREQFLITQEEFEAMRRPEAEAKMMEVLTKQQRRDLFRLLGIKAPEEDRTR